MLKNTFVLSVFFVFILISDSFAAASPGISYSQLLDGSKTIEFRLSDYTLETIENIDGTWTVIRTDSDFNTKIKGQALLPFFNVGVEMPDGVDYQFEITEQTYVDLTPEAAILPSRGTIYRNQDPEAIPYIYDTTQDHDNWYPGTIISNSDRFLFRSLKGTWLGIYPFQYMKNKNLLRVYTSLTIRILEKTAPMMRKSISNPSFSEPGVVDDICNDIFINHRYVSDDNSRLNTRYHSDEVGAILVIYTSRDRDAIQPWITWKKEKGFTVHEREVSTGTNVKSLIASVYESNENLLYVQLVGDWADIKSDLGTTQNAPMDPALGCVSGNDDTPDLAVGRFSASSAADVTVQVNKAINYEKNPSGDWYKKGLGIASDEGQGSGDDGEGDWEHMDIIKENKLLPYTYTNVVEAYKNPSDSDVENAVNGGLGVINYCGHGGPTSFVTSGFNNSDVNSLTNGAQLPIIFSVACVNGEFHKSGDCFAERWLKKENGGAVTVLMSTINQSWTPPMRGQDYMNDLLTGGYDYSGNPGSGTSTTDGRTTFGVIALTGVIMMKDDETLKTWTTFGDASLQVRTDSPKTISVPDSFAIKGRPYVTTVSTSGSAENVLVSLYQNGNTYSGLTGSSGGISINHSLNGGMATLVVSGYNLKTIYKTITVYNDHPGAGKISQFVWSDITGSTVKDLTDAADYPYSPDSNNDLTVFESSENRADNFGARIAGYIHPPENGEYTFWISGDDACDLYLSMSEHESAAQLIATVTNATSPQQWDKDAAQKSQSITLEKGKKYYIEALHKEDAGADHLAVAWQSDTVSREVIPGPFLSPYDKHNTVRFNSGGNGNVAGHLVQNLSDGESTMTVSAVAEAGYAFAGWTGDHTGTEKDLVIDNVNNDMSVTATFTKSNSGGGGGGVDDDSGNSCFISSVD